MQLKPLAQPSSPRIKQFLLAMKGTRTIRGDEICAPLARSGEAIERGLGSSVYQKPSVLPRACIETCVDASSRDVMVEISVIGHDFVGGLLLCSGCMD